MTFSSRQIRLIAAFAGLNVLLVIIGWMALVSPQRSDAATAAAKAQLAQTQLETLIGGSAHDHKQPVIHSASIYALDTALPSQGDEPGLLFELNRLATGSGVKVSGISLQTAQATASGYTVVPISLTLTGTYFKVADFLDRLRTLVSDNHGRLTAHGPVFAVNSVTLNPGSKGHDLLATVSIATFYYGVTAGATAPVAATTDTTTTTGS
jgi:Pilus assembly protein, PilO